MVKIETFFSYLAVHADVAPSTQNQAMNALVFLYRKVLKDPLGEETNAIRASKKKNIQVILTRDETAKLLSLMKGVPSPLDDLVED